MAERRLTREIAEQFLADDETVDMMGFTVIDDAAAEVLSKYDGKMLALPSLASLSDAAAASLGRVFYLTLGLETLSSKQALLLTNNNYYENPLDNITDRFEDPIGLQYRSIAYRSFPYVEELESDVAQVLGNSRADLCLDGLASLSDAAMESLSKHGNDLSLGGLTSLSDAAAENLSKHEGYLGLTGLTSLSDVASESLSQHVGPLMVRLDNLPASAAARIFP